MPESTHKVIDPQNSYDVIELIGTNTNTWEEAAKYAVEQAKIADGPYAPIDLLST